MLRTEADGRITAGGILPGRQNLLPKFARYVARRSDQTGKLRVAIGHALCEDEATRLQELLYELLPVVGRCTITDLGSALGVHGGPRTLIVAVQNDLDPDQFRRSRHQPGQ